jgi:hypothetical protein
MREFISCSSLVGAISHLFAFVLYWNDVCCWKYFDIEAAIKKPIRKTIRFFNEFFFVLFLLLSIIKFSLACFFPFFSFYIRGSTSKEASLFLAIQTNFIFRIFQIIGYSDRACLTEKYNISTVKYVRVQTNVQKQVKHRDQNQQEKKPCCTLLVKFHSLIINSRENFILFNSFSLSRFRTPLQHSGFMHLLLLLCFFSLFLAL